MGKISIISDMDDVIYRGSNLIPGAAILSSGCAQVTHAFGF
jgi:hypothetical protein